MTGQASQVSDVIAAIGRPEFSRRFLSLMFEGYGVEACAMYRLNRTTPVAVVTSTVGSQAIAQQQADAYLKRRFWLRDPAMLEACQNAINQRASTCLMDIGSMTDPSVRQLFTDIKIKERLIVCDGNRARDAVLTLVKTNASSGFSDRQREHIERTAPILLAFLRKHIELADCAGSASMALTSFPEIESCIAQAALNLSRREAQVASRIIYGLSNAGIASDLGIGEATVTTYRKRLYRRLSVGSQRELVTLYLQLWSGARGSLGNTAMRRFRSVM